MNDTELIRLQINQLVTQARYDLYNLSTNVDPVVKQLTIQRVWDTISSIHFLSGLLAHAPNSPTHYQQLPSKNTLPSAPNSTQPINERTFTTEQLKNFDGKSGRAAYVAVNGIVYDVTNNSAWAAATHFGLAAGDDYTSQFASCHAGQAGLLSNLPVVGRLV